MYTIRFKVRGANALEALQRLQTVGLDPEQFAGEIVVRAAEVDSIHNLVQDLGISDWTAEQD